MGVREKERGKERRTGEREKKVGEAAGRGENEERVISWRTGADLAVAVRVSGVMIWERK